MVSKELEKRQKECEQTYCQAWADTALASPKRPELQDQGCCGEGPLGHTELKGPPAISPTDPMLAERRQKPKINTKEEFLPPPQKALSCLAVTG